MVYRDPTLTKMAQELLEERGKNALLEEENVKLRSLLKAEVEAEPEITLNLRSSWVHRLSCVLLGKHQFMIDVNVPGLLGLLGKTYDGNRPVQLTREEFSYHCSIQCRNCTKIVKDYYQVSNTESLFLWIEIVSLINRAFNEFREHYPHALRSD